MTNITGEPTNGSGNDTYADVSDVELFLRNYEIDANTDPNKSQVENLIQKRTEYVERRISTAFRELEINNYQRKISVPKEIQNRELNRYRTVGYSPHAFSTSKFIEVSLPHEDIRNISDLILYTELDKNDINVSKQKNNDNIRIDERSGKIFIDKKLFTINIDGSLGNNRYKGARIEANYNYGRNRIPKDMNECVTKLVVYDLVNSDSYGKILPEDIDTVDPDDFARRLKDEAEETINYYKNSEEYKYI